MTTIVPYAPERAADVAKAYNALIRPVPHCYPMDTETFHAAVAAACTGGSSYDLVHDERAFVALYGADVIGFAHTAVGYRRPDEPQETGIIRFLWYRAGERAAGKEILSCAEQTLRAQGMTDVVAFPQIHRYPYHYLSSAYLSDRLGHVAALLGMAGYQRTAGEVYFDWRDLSLVEPTPAQVEAEITLEWKPGAGRLPGLTVHAHQGETEVGVCMNVSCAEYNVLGEDQDWAFTKWLGVVEELRGQGLGKYLLQLALRELQQAGYRHAAISTALTNYRAALFYSNLGYRVVDWTYEYGRRFEQC
jgi:ribosomal protein S18 acetylase RimI-like enzyme